MAAPPRAGASNTKRAITRFNGVVLGLAGAYTDAVLTSDAPLIGGLRGDALPTVPRWSGAATMDYTFQAFGAWDATVGASYRVNGARKLVLSE
ncbi:MAG: hypothetical protein WDN69_33330 [Aliidongia sp.]